MLTEIVFVRVVTKSHIRSLDREVKWRLDKNESIFTMAVLIYLDSAYIGFVFLVLTEIFLVRVVTQTQIRSLDREVKRRLDKGIPVELDLRDYGPMKVNTRMGLAKITALVFPAAFILAMVALGELGISGRSISTYSAKNVITVGGYFTLDVIETPDYQRAPPQFSGKWPTCVEYSRDSVVASQAIITYEITEGEIELGLVSCSDQESVVVKDLGSTCYEQDPDHSDFSYFHFNTTSIGNVVYYDSYKLNLNLIYNGETTVTSGEAVVGPCSGQAGGPGHVFWVETSNSDTTYAIVDDSFRLGDDSSRERWVIDPGASVSLGRSNTGSWTVIVECESGCLEAIMEWVLLEGTQTIDQVGSFLSIWYEGLNYGQEETGPVCDSVDSGSSGWYTTDDLFKEGSCEGAVGEKVVLDGGEQNVTLVSAWAIWIVVVGCVSTLLYRCMARQDGYDLLTYEGISKVYYEDINPGHVWKRGGALVITPVGNRLSARTIV